jgi:PAS domain S-box-containing protein
MTISGPSLTDPFQLRRQRIGYLIAALAMGAYALLSCLFLYRLVVDYYPARLGDFVLVLVGLIASVVNLIWLRQNVRELRQVGAALLEGETTLRTFIDALPEPAFLLDQNGCFLATNRIIETEFKRNCQELVGTYAFGLLRPALATSRKAYFDQVLQTGQAVQFEDTSRERHFINYMCPVFDATGHISRVAVFAFDITERKNAETVIQTQYDQLAAQNEELQAQTADLLAQERALSQAEAELRQLNAELEKRVNMRTAELAAANRELESFSHSISHDLRAPLRAIDGFTRILDEDYRSQLDPAARYYLQRIQTSVNHMGALIDNLLQLARLARAEPHRSAVNLSTLAHSIVDELCAADPARQVDFDCAPNLVAQADPHLIRTVLQNLLGNAWKFTAKHATARIELGCTQANGETVYFVRDNGAGFDMRYISKLFGVFQRLHSNEEFGGTGVGLASVQRILHRHGGRIWAEGAVEAGATFYFTLPEDTHTE